MKYNKFTLSFVVILIVHIGAIIGANNPEQAKRMAELTRKGIGIVEKAAADKAAAIAQKASEDKKNNTQTKAAEESQKTANAWGVNNTKEGIELANGIVTLGVNIVGIFNWTRQLVYQTQAEKDAEVAQQQFVENEKIKQQKAALASVAHEALTKCLIKNIWNSKNTLGIPYECEALLVAYGEATTEEDMLERAESYRMRVERAEAYRRENKK